MRVYKLTNTVNGKIYVGQTVQKYVSNRIAQHRFSQTTAIGRAMRKYGREAFIHEVVEEVGTLFELNEREQFWIGFYDCMTPHGYNILGGGRNSLHTEASKEKMRAAKQGYRPWNKGVPHSESTKSKISAINKGRLSGDRNPFFGKTHSAETLAKISAAHVGLKMPHLVELNKSRIGTHPSPDSLEKMAEARRQWWANRKAAS